MPVMLKRLLAPTLCSNTRLHGRRAYATTSRRLPLDVVLRRMQSSSLTNQARSLDAHFADLLTASTGGKPSSTSVSDGDVDCNGGTEAAAGSRGTHRPVRELLSTRLEDEMVRDSSTKHLSLDDLSLILSNSIRHGLSPTLVHSAAARLIEVLSGTQWTGSQRLRATVASGDVARIREAESLIRVMEACVDAEEVRANSWGGGLVMEQWVSLVVAVEQRWAVFVGDSSTRYLLPQFLSLGLAEHLWEGDSAVLSTGLSSFGGAAGTRYGLSSLQVDPVLVRQRCFLLCERAAAAVIMGEEGAAPHFVAQQPAELVRLCHAVRRIKWYEYRDRAHTPPGAANVAATTAAPDMVYGMVATASLLVSRLPSLWPSSSSSVSSTGRRKETPHHHQQQSQKREMRLYQRFGLYVTAQLLTQSGGGDSQSAPSLLQRVTLAQASVLFATVCDTAPTAAAAELSFSICAVLRRHDTVVDLVGLHGILTIGEVCIRVPDGTNMVLAEVLRSLQRSAFTLLLPATTNVTNSVMSVPDETTEGALWARACEVVIAAPLAVRDVAEQTLLVFIKAVLHPASVTAVASPTLLCPPCEESSELRRYSRQRYGTLLLVWQLLNHAHGYLPPELELCVRRLVELVPFSAGTEPQCLSAAVRAASIYALLASLAYRKGDTGALAHYRYVTMCLIADINTILQEGTHRLSEHERSLLRNVLRVLGELRVEEARSVARVTVAPQQGAAQKVVTPPHADLSGKDVAGRCGRSSPTVPTSMGWCHHNRPPEELHAGVAALSAKLRRRVLGRSI